ncbi:hypothetical protein CCHR01_09769 [Colletotrichum chrysophilum]|uniref:Uncharacterized protein n=1 Tax=Colletotrichum chrysophilum TaxID=1836956 RepID=A0AAD9AH87_9PEZI|nr:hypothetical protein CCHR01_09769 [Colletotrichum chrysophilum]
MLNARFLRLDSRAVQAGPGESGSRRHVDAGFNDQKLVCAASDGESGSDLLRCFGTRFFQGQLHGHDRVTWGKNRVTDMLVRRPGNCWPQDLTRGGLEILYALGGLFETKHRLVSVSSLYRYSFFFSLFIPVISSFFRDTARFSRSESVVKSYKFPCR